MGKMLPDILDIIYKKSQNIMERIIQDETIVIITMNNIVDFEHQSLFTLNGIGWEIWNKIDGKRTVSGIINELENMYEVDKDTLSNDISNFFADLHEKRIVVTV